MEDGLGVEDAQHQSMTVEEVLILVLVEDGLGVRKEFRPGVIDFWCLNPCFSGGWSRSMDEKLYESLLDLSLNPCFSGGWSRRANLTFNKTWTVERLNPCFSGGWSRSGRASS